MNHQIQVRVLIALFLALHLQPNLTSAQSPPSDALEEQFASPPDQARPRTWWHWTNGNVSKDGITKDLEWMKRVGIGGMMLADVASGGGQEVETKILFGSPQWLDAVHHAASEADRLGLEMTLFSSAGWSETGGPWVKPEGAMKKLVWSETNVEGPKTFDGELVHPPTVNGLFQDLARGGARNGPPDPTFYGDSAVIAFRTPADESSMAERSPKVTTSAGTVDGAALMDGKLGTSLPIPTPGDGKPAWVQYEFAEPFKAKAITLVAPGRGVPFGRILSSDDGEHFRPLIELPGPEQYRAGTVRTYALPAEVSAKFFRMEITGAAPDPAGVMSQNRTQPAPQYPISEFVLHTGARVDRWQEKAGFNFYYQYEQTPTPSVPSASSIAHGQIVDLASKMTKEGKLTWEVPAGKWTILRLGYSLTGAKNRPAPPTGSGYEADKLSRKYIEEYFHGYTDPIAKELGPLFGKSVRYVMMDSWEAGMQNWTDEMIGEFKTRRGYDPTPFLPVLTGKVVDSADASDRFLWDFRRTLADMFAENHYGTMADQLKKHGIGIYGEAAGVSMEILEDTLLNKSKMDIPMGEFWVRALHPELQYYVDVRGAASAAHVYGKKLVATESFTGGGYESPFTLKKVADYWFAQGVNRLVFHTSAHQPLDTKPGNTMVGTHINRNITWAEQGGPFMTYLSRCSHMLQQGLFVADLAYLLPEGVPSSQPFWGGGLQPAPPEGYDYDCINTDVLLHRMSVSEDGRLTLPDGMSYRVLVLPQSSEMRPEVLKKIRELVLGGATVVGPRAIKSPSLAGFSFSPRGHAGSDKQGATDPARPQGLNELSADEQLRALANDVWGDLDGVIRNKRYFGKGLVTWGLPLADVLRSMGVAKDFEYSRPLDSEVVWIHRRAGDAEIYFVANRSDRAMEVDARFRVSGKEAEIWHPDTGMTDSAAYSITDDRTIVPLHLAERESVFVVFRKSAGAPVRALPAKPASVVTPLGGPWDVSFPPDLGAPAQIKLDALQSWTENKNEGVKYFSGTATYTYMLEANDESLRPGATVTLDLGTVKDIAQVSVNGKALTTLWKPPYQVDVTASLKPGANELEIKVTNEWTNRQVGDRAGPPEKRVLSGGAAPRFGRPAVISESGLIGPVTIKSVAAK